MYKFGAMVCCLVIFTKIGYDSYSKNNKKLKQVKMTWIIRENKIDKTTTNESRLTMVVREDTISWGIFFSKKKNFEKKVLIKKNFFIRTILLDIFQLLA